MSEIYKGGYVTIDIEGLDLDNSGAGQTIPGIYAKLIETKGKPVIFRNVGYSTAIYDVVIPAASQFTAETNDVTFYAYIGTDLYLTVTSEDNATIALNE